MLGLIWIGVGFFLLESVAAGDGVRMSKCEKNVSKAAVSAGDCAQNAEQN